HTRGGVARHLYPGAHYQFGYRNQHIVVKVLGAAYGYPSDDVILGVEVAEHLGVIHRYTALLGNGRVYCQKGNNCKKEYSLHLSILSPLKYIKQLLIFVKR